MELTDNEKSLIGFALACYLEDLDKQLRKLKLGKDSPAYAQRNMIEQITYTKIIPDSWSGPKPNYWRD